MTLTLTDANIQGKGAARGTITERGYGIYSEERGVTYEVKGTCTVAGDVDNPALVFYGTNTNPNKATIAGDGTLQLKSNVEAIFDSGTNDTLTIDGTVDSADIVAVIKEMPDGDKKADVNNDGAIDSADIVAVIKAMK